MRLVHPLLTLRIERGWSRKELARHANLHLSTIAYIESTGHAPRYPTRRGILLALDVPFAEHKRIFGPGRSRS